MFKVLLVLFVLSSLSNNGDSARILAVVPTPSYSHQIALWPIWKSLSSRGHNVTLITTDPDPRETNITQINIDFAYEVFRRHDFTRAVEKNKNDFFKMMDFFLTVMKDTSTAILESEDVQKLIRGNDEFDVAIIEVFLGAIYPLVEKFKVPFIGVASLEPLNLFYEVLGNPTHPVAYPDIALPFTKNLTFFERVASSFVWVYMKYLERIILVQDNIMVKKYYGEDYPSVESVLNKIDMLLINANPILGNVRPLVPSTVYIGGGLHIKEPKPLPEDLRRYLDEAEEGVIYFSLGSNVKSTDLTEETKQVIIETLAELPYKVLWKFEGEDLPGKPDNVKIVKWSPQQDVLRHPNVKVFITQGGIQSIDEAIYNKVPMVGIPFFGDQPNNVRKLVEKGICLSIDHFTIEKESFKTTILEVIENPKYRNRIEEMSNLIIDQPMSGLEKAVWWTEYVIRHKGAKHLRSPVIDIPFYQYYLLDVIGFMGAIFITLSFVGYKSVKLCWRFVKFIYSKMFCTSKEKKL